ncbi:hypothetical protein BD779DRAFT_126768 [Infundibulicybe gibba]|nr:hypothetical protein BD779DRAFT_126768 [Infundibulicybe gibba]
MQLITTIKFHQHCRSWISHLVYRQEHKGNPRFGVWVGSGVPRPEFVCKMQYTKNTLPQLTHVSNIIDLNSSACKSLTFSDACQQTYEIAMAGFLRKKVKHDAQPNPVAANPEAVNVSTTTVTPLFARFSTTHKPVEEVTSHRIVSSPMVLSSPSTRRDAGRTTDGHSTRTTNGVRGDEGDRRRKKSGRVDTSIGSPPYVKNLSPQS